MHVLISLAKRRPYAVKPTLPPNAEYDRTAGRWRIAGEFMVESGMPPTNTKKCDQETGEDQKGE